ncbi:hypothetical protein RND81_04G211100 [Saponaria officinalis]|uniref:Uncharacterized protein n=1 Tax=Saponaria officinalis TaxID=3572 RepID=A0AAW1LFR9_SAPOF
MAVKEEEEEEKSKRQRFYIQLKPGETAIVSWKKLLRDASHIHHSSSFPKTLLDGNSSVGQRKNSLLKDEKLGHKTKARLSDNKQLTVPLMKFPTERKKSNAPTRKLEDCKSVCRLALTKAPSMLPKYISRYDKSFVPCNQQLEGLHDVPVTYSMKTSSYCGRLNLPSPVNVPEVTSVFPLKTKHDIPLQNQKLSDCMNPSFARSFPPLLTYRRSKNLVDGIKSKVPSMVHNDNDSTPCQKRKVTDTGDRHISDPSPYDGGTCKKVAVECPSLLSKSSHYAKTIKFKPSREENPINVPRKPHLKEPEMEVPGKANVKIRFCLKSDQESGKFETTQLK